LDDVEADLRTMGIKRWRLIAKDRTEWAGIVREAKALQGPYSQREEYFDQERRQIASFGVWIILLNLEQFA
jgi:hypothetical protein